MQQPPAGQAPPPPGYEPPPAQPTGYREWLRLSPWWQKLLVILPLILIVLGGLVGAVVGVGAAAVNYFVMRMTLPGGAKVGIGLGVTVLAVVLWLVIGLMVMTATHPA